MGFLHGWASALLQFLSDSKTSKVLAEPGQTRILMCVAGNLIFSKAGALEIHQGRLMPDDQN